MAAVGSSVRRAYCLANPTKRKPFHYLRWCSRCTTVKWYDQMNANSWCKACKNATGKKHYSESKEYKRDWALARNYGLTRAELNDIIAQQDGKCASCRIDLSTVKKYVVDHDHSCCKGAKTCGSCRRGVLCNTCNVGIGLLGDSLEGLKKAQAYLEAHHAD